MVCARCEGSGYFGDLVGNRAGSNPVIASGDVAELEDAPSDKTVADLSSGTLHLLCFPPKHH